MNEKQRRHERVKSSNLLYLCIKDDNGVITKQGMGRTLNVSESGIRLETTFPLDSKKSLWLTIGFEDDLVDLKGKIEYYIENNNKYEFGIRFIEPDERSRVILSQYVKIFNQSGH